MEFMEVAIGILLSKISRHSESKGSGDGLYVVRKLRYTGSDGGD